MLHRCAITDLGTEAFLEICAPSTNHIKLSTNSNVSLFEQKKNDPTRVTILVSSDIEGLHVAVRLSVSLIGLKNDLFNFVR